MIGDAEKQRQYDTKGNTTTPCHPPLISTFVTYHSSLPLHSFPTIPLEGLHLLWSDRSLSYYLLLVHPNSCPFHSYHSILTIPCNTLNFHFSSSSQNRKHSHVAESTDQKPTDCLALNTPIWTQVLSLLQRNTRNDTCHIWL